MSWSREAIRRLKDCDNGADPWHSPKGRNLYEPHLDLSSQGSSAVTNRTLSLDPLGGIAMAEYS